MGGDLRRLDTGPLGLAAVELDDLADAVAATRVAATRLLARTGCALPATVTVLAAASAALAGQADDLRARVGLALHWDDTTATAGWRNVRTVRASLEHLGADADALLRRLPEDDRRDDPLDALVAAARSGHVDATTLVRSLRPLLDRLAQRPDGLQVLVELVRAVVPDAPEADLLPLLGDLLANEAATGGLASSTVDLVRDVLSALVVAALTTGDDIDRVVDLLGPVDGPIVRDLLPHLAPEEAARLLLAIALRDDLDLGVAGVLPLLAMVLTDPTAVAGLTSVELATLLSLVARSVGTPNVEGTGLAALIRVLAGRLRPGGDLRAVQDDEGRALLTDADVRRLIVLGDPSIAAAAVDDALAELESLLTDADGQIAREVSVPLGHTLRSLGLWFGTVVDAVSDAATDRAGFVEGLQDALGVVASGVVPGGAAAGIAAGVAAGWLDELQGLDAEDIDDATIARALRAALEGAANHAIPSLAISAVMDGFREAAMDT